MLKIIARLVVALAVLVLAGCAFQQPQLTYPEGSVPNSQTAIIMRNPPDDLAIVGITSVNGRPTSCVAQGCPFWIRVKPGLTKIGIKVTVFGGVGTYSSKDDLYLEVDALPRHTYLIEYVIRGAGDKSVTARITDAGTQYKGGYQVRGGFYPPVYEP